MALAFKREQEKQQAAVGVFEAWLEKLVGKKIPVTVAWDETKKIEGSVTQGEEKPRKVIALMVLSAYVLKPTDYSGFGHAIATICKDADGKAAFCERVESLQLEVHGVPDKAGDKEEVHLEDKKLVVKIFVMTSNFYGAGSSGTCGEAFKKSLITLFAGANLQFKRTQAEVAKLVTVEEEKLEKHFGKKVPIVVDYAVTDAIKGATLDGDKGPRPANCLALMLYPEYILKGQLTTIIMKEVCKDDLGKEAFLETFDSLKLQVLGCAKPAVKTEVAKEGKTLVIRWHVVPDDNYHGAGNSGVCWTVKAGIEKLL